MISVLGWKSGNKHYDDTRLIQVGETANFVNMRINYLNMQMSFMYKLTPYTFS
jgi:hypothetical protein